MTQKQAQKIFEKYNPEQAVTRCPNGRSPVRKLLDTYARAAVNLYGVISKAELADIFNRQNTEQTSADEVFRLLLPIALKRKWYCFYQEYIVHYWAFDNFEYADYWLKAQGDKPRFIPEKDTFLKYENQYYESETQRSHWDKLREFIFKAWPDKPRRFNFYFELKDTPIAISGLQGISDLMDKCGLVFEEKNQGQMFFDLLMGAHNNTRLMTNKGYTPNELRKIMEESRPKDTPPQIVVQSRVKIGLNAPCPCGSGKKYKKCCRLIEEAKTAQLTTSECILFYETWYGIMGFINEQKKIIDAVIKPVYPNRVGDEQVYKVREVLWENPSLIDDYLNAAKLSEEKTELIKSWRDRHMKGMFFLVEYKPEYAVAIGPNEQNEDRLYGIKGISRSLADTMQRELPIQFETVLLPFKDKIIYDSYINTMSIHFGEGAKKAFREMHENALVHGIITDL